MLYLEAAPFLTGSKPGSLKGTIYSTYEKRSKELKADPRQVVVLVTNTLRYKTMLADVIKQSRLLKEEKRLTLPVAQLMVYDLLVSKSGRINCGKHLLKDAVLRHKTRLKSELVRYKIKHRVQNIEDLVEVEDDETPVRWIRLNPLRVDGDITDLETKLMHKKTVVQTVGEISKGCIYKDTHVKNLYGIHPTEPITTTLLYKAGQIIIQDRASCFPAEILSPVTGQHLIDACSAPGNKTTHLAAHVNGKQHTITAFERDTKRSGVLRKMVTIAGAEKCVDIKVQDFTDADPQEYENVVGMLVDPSCSGSGIFGRGFDEESNEQTDKFRLQKLAEFQFKIVSHALSFPNVKTVVYSTCSIHAEENEQVVHRLLKDLVIKRNGWRLRPKNRVLASWPRRGVQEDNELTADQAEACIRAVPKVDGGIGFFAACFERDLA